MYATAHSLVRASVLAKDPLAPPSELRRALFLRFYGREFGDDDRERIMAWLGRDSPELPETRRRVPVNWDDLETALTSNVEEWGCYLDLRCEVQIVPIDRFGDSDDWPSAGDIDADLAAGHLIQVEPLGPSAEYGWMTMFAESVADSRLRARLEIALDGRGAFRRFKKCSLATQRSVNAGLRSAARGYGRRRGRGWRTRGLSRRPRRRSGRHDRAASAGPITRSAVRFVRLRDHARSALGAHDRS
jgi:hypothetical protein